MKNLRQFHLYLGCLFAPLIVYFSLSGAWQVFRFNDIPRGEAPTAIQSVFHAASNPHTHSAFPGRDPKTSQSVGFNIVACFMGLGLATTSILGVVIAAKSRYSNTAFLCLFGGFLVPLIFLVLK